jgi:hypothetical protein
LTKKRQEIYSWLHETGYPHTDVIIKKTRDKHLIA